MVAEGVERNYHWDFPGGLVAKSLSSQCGGPGFDPWSGNKILHVATESLHVATEEPHGLQLRPSTAKQIN